MRTAPVGTFEPNCYGLYDMAGDVWEWSDDWYRSTHTDPDAPACCIAENPRCGTVEASLVPCSRSLRSLAGSSRAARTCVPELLPAL